MALPTNGTISIEDILQEMGRPSSTTVNLNSLAAEWYTRTGLAVFNKTSHSLSDWYGKNWAGLEGGGSTGSGGTGDSDKILIISPNDYLTGNGADTDSVRIRVTSNINWSVRVNSGPSVVSFNVDSGNGDGTIIVTFQPNLYEPVRMGSIAVFGNGLSEIFTWTQKGAFFGNDNNGGGSGGEDSGSSGGNPGGSGSDGVPNNGGDGFSNDGNTNSSFQ